MAKALLDNNIKEIINDPSNFVNDDIWLDSKYELMKRMVADKTGYSGEKIIKTICENLFIQCNINGSKRKNDPLLQGDGTIYDKIVEIKTATIGNNKTFQHELSNYPWIVNNMIFVDIKPNNMLITIIPAFTKEECQTGIKTKILPTKKITKRKEGFYKFDFSKLTINTLIKNGYTIDYDSIPKDNFNNVLTRFFNKHL
jgi:hypothetical protein